MSFIERLRDNMRERVSTKGVSEGIISLNQLSCRFTYTYVSMSSEGGDNSEAFDLRRFVESLCSDISRIVDQRLELVHERFDKVEAAQSDSKGSRSRRKVTPLELEGFNYNEDLDPRARRTRRNSSSRGEPNQRN